MKKKPTLWIGILVSGGIAACLIVGLIQKSPAWILFALQKNLQNKLIFERASYAFPFGIEIRGLSIVQGKPFDGSPSLGVKRAWIQVSLPALFQGRVEISNGILEEPSLMLRRFNGRIHHPFAGPSAQPKPNADSSAGAIPSVENPKPDLVDLSMIRLEIRDGSLQWIDYDAASGGFGLNVQRIQGRLQNLSLRPRNQRMSYRVEAEILQGRQHKPARIRFDGWSHRESIDTDANLHIDGLWIPYYRPYLMKLTSAVIQDGLLSLQTTAQIQNRDFVSNGKLLLSNLWIDTFEQDGLFFDFDATALLEILKNQDGRIEMDLIIRWDMKDSDMSFKKILRKSISHSLKSTFFKNIQNVVQNTLEEISRDPERLKKDWKSLLGGLQDIVD